MTYFEINKCKDRCNIAQGDPTWDDMLNSFGLAADQEVDAILYETYAKNRHLFQIPVLPLPTPVDQSIRDASTNRVVAKWWRRQKDWDGSKASMEESELAITNYISRLKVDIVHYGTLV